jgi:hypothetical protein
VSRYVCDECQTVQPYGHHPWCRRRYSVEGWRKLRDEQRELDARIPLGDKVVEP